MTYFTKYSYLSARLYSTFEELYKYNPNSGGDFIGYSQARGKFILYYGSLFIFIILLLSKIIWDSRINHGLFIVFSVLTFGTIIGFISDLVRIRIFKKRSLREGNLVYESGLLILGNKKYSLEHLE